MRISKLAVALPVFLAAAAAACGGDGGGTPTTTDKPGLTILTAGADTIGYGVDLANAPALTCTGASMVARGGKDADTISGTSGNDRLFGNKGEDLIKAIGGDDVVFGGDDSTRPSSAGAASGAGASAETTSVSGSADAAGVPKAQVNRQTVSTATGRTITTQPSSAGTHTA